MKKRIISLLLCLVMVVGLLPVTAYADSEEHECWYCGAIYYGDVSSELYSDCCGICAPDTHNDCWFESHCWECGACYMEINSWCTDCTLCADCIEAHPETHCSSCGECHLGTGEDELCGNCYKCDSCTSICESCGFCDECAADASDPMHCIICDACFEDVPTAEHDGSSAKHCVDCCSYCEQCEGWETCMTDATNGVYCDECGLCVDCCQENREAAGFCDLYCIESSEYEEHICEECGECWCDVEQCPDCGLCMDCCEANSDCYGSTKMCVEDSDYDDHFCPECGESCICEDDYCDVCGLCADCCGAALEEAMSMCNEDCDTSDFECVDDLNFIQHMEDAHGGYRRAHTCVWKKAYSMNENNHWHECAFKSCNKIYAQVPHSYAGGSDICYECGYKKGAMVYFTTQPSDVRVQVSDDNDYHRDYYAPLVDGERPIVYGPTHRWNNRTTFRVKAFGKNLTYQWYESYKGSSTAKMLTDNTAGIEYSSDKYISGATTPNLTISVDNDACTANYVYYCVVTDDKDNTAASDRAEMIATHRYTVAKADTTDVGGKNIYFADALETNGYRQEFIQASTGHRWYCCGEEHGSYFVDHQTRDRTAKPHNFDETGDCWAAYTATAAAEGNYINFTEFECADCGYKKYVETHEHHMVPQAFDGSHKDAATKHQLICKAVDGCVETSSAPHSWEFVIVTYPDGTNSGVVNRRCVECFYVDQNFTWKAYGETGYESKSWNAENMLINVDGGSANLTLAEPGNTIVLTPELDGVHKLGGWTVKYYYPGETGEYEAYKDITLTISKQENGTWKCPIPADFFTDNDVPGGGLLWFAAIKGAKCTDHSETMVVGKKDAVCMHKGYTGDKVCKDCGKVVNPGTEIAAPATEHTGELTLVEGTAVEASCTTRGYEGDFKCDVCGGIVRGENMGYAHNAVVEDAVLPTCTEKGYSGNTVCKDCDKVLSAGRELNPLTHDWDDGTIKDPGNLKVFTCQRVNCGATKVLRTVPKLEREDGTTIISVNFNMTGYVSGGLTKDLKVNTKDNVTPARIVFAKNPVKNGKIDMDDRSNKPLNTVSDTFQPGKTYYLVVLMELHEGYSFHKDMTADHVKLNEKQTAKLFDEVQIVFSDIGGNSLDPITRTVAVFTLQALPCTITFNPGEGSGAMDSVSTKSKTYILPDCGFTAPDGKEFNCWQVKDAEKLVGEMINVNGDVTVTALWKEIPGEKPAPTPPSGGASGGSGSKPSTTTTATGTAKSADTGDAGIAVYAALSLMSMTGGAWLVSKKRRTR